MSGTQPVQLSPPPHPSFFPRVRDTQDLDHLKSGVKTPRPEESQRFQHDVNLSMQADALYSATLLPPPGQCSSKSDVSLPLDKVDRAERSCSVSMDAVAHTNAGVGALTSSGLSRSRLQHFGNDVCLLPGSSVSPNPSRSSHYKASHHFAGPASHFKENTAIVTTSRKGASSSNKENRVYPAAAPDPLPGALVKHYSCPPPDRVSVSDVKSVTDQNTEGTSALVVRGSQSIYQTKNTLAQGRERVVGYNTIRGQERILSEAVVEYEVKVPKRIVREDRIEKLVVIPETVVREEIVEEVQKAKERVIQVVKPIIQEKIVEVDHVEYREKLVEVVEKVVQHKIKHVPRIQYKERIIHVPKYIPRERIVEIPEIEYHRVPVEKIVHVPEIREKFVIKPVPVPQYVEKLVPQYVTIEKPVEIERNIPVPVEAVTTLEYQLTQMRPKVQKVKYPLYVPRFVEVPVSAELFDETQITDMQQRLRNLSSSLTGPQAIGLADVEDLATGLRQSDILSSCHTTADYEAALSKAWKQGRLTINTARTQATCDIQSEAVRHLVNNDSITTVTSA